MDLLAGKILGFVMVMSRIGAFISVAPIFGRSGTPRPIRIGMLVVVSIFFANTIGCPLRGEDVMNIQAMILIAHEMIYGLALGLVCSFIFGVVKLSARIAERQMGFAMANVLDPVTGDKSQSLSLMLDMIFTMLFLSANGHHMFLVSLSRSYQTFPAGAVPQIEVLFKSVLLGSCTMMTLGLKMSAPILGAFLLMMVVLAVMARIAPETNILFLSLPIRVGLGLIMVGIFVPFINMFVKEVAGYMDKLMPL